MNEKKFEYFIEQTNKQFDELKVELKEIRADLSVLKRFKWQLVTGAIVVSIIFTAAIQILDLVFKR